MPTSTGPVRLGQLLSMSYAFVTAYWRPILIGAVVFGTIGAFVQGAVQTHAATKFGGMIEGMGMNLERMEELSERMQAGDESAAGEFEDLMENSFGGVTETEMQKTIGMGMVTTMLPNIGLMFLVSIILTVLASAYYYMITLGAVKDPVKAASGIPKLFLPLLGLHVWIFLRSFIWIPIIGLIPAIILCPRFVLAPVILIQEKKGIMQSVTESYKRTTGYWGKIAGNIIVMALCAFALGIVVGIISGLLGNISPYISLWINSVFQYLVFAYATVFVVQLSLTIMSNPLSTVPMAPLAPAAAKAPQISATKKIKKT